MTHRDKGDRDGVPRGRQRRRQHSCRRRHPPLGLPPARLDLPAVVHHRPLPLRRCLHHLRVVRRRHLPLEVEVVVIVPLKGGLGFVIPLREYLTLRPRGKRRSLLQRMEKMM